MFCLSRAELSVEDFGGKKNWLIIHVDSGAGDVQVESKPAS